MKKKRNHYSAEDKVAILRRHLLDKEPISKLCDELGLQPTVFYRWQKEFFENVAAAFEQKRPANHPTFTVADETHNFRIRDHTGAISQALLQAGQPSQHF